MSLLECYGQNQAISRLQRARHTQRVPHGYIFHGPQGVGKGLLARQWAKVLLCQNHLTRKKSDQIDTSNLALNKFVDCCDACDDCHLVQAETHPDLHIIYPQLAQYLPPPKNKQKIALSIDVIREFLIKQAGLLPTRKQAKIFIIEQAETMTRPAQNALLKTLEEPPPNTFIILLAARPTAFLTTIRSRCHDIRLGPLPKDFIYKKLCENKVNETSALYWSDFSNGRLGWALTLANMGIYDKKQKLIEQLSQLNYDTMLVTASWIQAAAKEFGKTWLNDNPDDTPAATERQGYRCWLEILAHTLSMSLRASIGQKRGQPIEADQADLLIKIGNKYGAWGCSEAIRATYAALGHLQANVNPGLLLESLLLQYLEYE